jgi:hypothetical protein
MDPRRTERMAKVEKSAWQYFRGLKDLYLATSPRWWKKYFKSKVDEYIESRLDEWAFMTSDSCQTEEEEERERIHVHGIRRLVAGAAQEWELVQQPKYAAICAELDGALVWQGRGYVSSILCVISSSLQLSSQSQFEKVSTTLWLVMLEPFP